MNTNPSKQKPSTQANAAPQTKSDPSWWRDDVHGRAWAAAKPGVSQSWKDVEGNETLPQRMRTGETDKSLNDDLDRNASGQDFGSKPPDRLAQQDRDRSASRAGHDDLPLRYGVGARHEFGKEHPEWDAQLARQLREEWSQRHGSVGRSWDDVEREVRHGYEYDPRIGESFRKA